MSANGTFAASGGAVVHDAITSATIQQPAPSNPIADAGVIDSTETRTPETSQLSISHSGQESPTQPRGPARTDTNTAIMQSQLPPSPPPAATSTNPISRVTSSAIGPSVDQPTLPAKDEDGNSPKLQITLLLTNGARYPFKLDARYLSKRNVTVQDDDPYNLSVYKLKELILREWREEWEVKPSSPSYIRLITFGRLLDDKASLKDQRFNPDAPNVVHMTIKPQDFVDEEEGGKGAKAAYAGRRSSGEGNSPGCRCVIM